MRNQKKRKFKIQVDPKFNDLMVTQFVNNLMFSGKKNISYNIFYDALEIVEQRVKEHSGYDLVKEIIIVGEE